jgi:hypothetical protein
MRARNFTLGHHYETMEEPCKGGILVEEYIMERSQSPSGATFSCCKLPGIFLMCMEEKLVNFICMIIPLMALFLNTMLPLPKYRLSRA